MEIKNYSLIFTSEECESIISYSERMNEWKRVDGITSSYYHTHISLDWVNDRFAKYIKECENLEIEKNKFVKILKYAKGDKFEPHKDYDENRKFYSTFMYNINAILNDDFLGGDFIVNDIVYPKNKGWCYYYNSREIHEVKEVTEGIRYSILFGVFSDSVKKNSLI